MGVMVGKATFQCSVWFPCSVVEPISSIAQLVINTKPELDKYTIPKMMLNVIFEEIGVALSKNQVCNIVVLSQITAALVFGCKCVDQNAGIKVSSI